MFPGMDNSISFSGNASTSFNSGFFPWGQGASDTGNGQPPIIPPGYMKDFFQFNPPSRFRGRPPTGQHPTTGPVINDGYNRGDAFSQGKGIYNPLSGGIGLPTLSADLLNGASNISSDVFGYNVAPVNGGQSNPPVARGRSSSPPKADPFSGHFGQTSGFHGLPTLTGWDPSKAFPPSYPGTLSNNNDDGSIGFTPGGFGNPFGSSSFSGTDIPSW